LRKKLTAWELKDGYIERLTNPAERGLRVPKKDFNDIRYKRGDISFEEVTPKKE